MFRHIATYAVPAVLCAISLIAGCATQQKVTATTPDNTATITAKAAETAGQPAKTASNTPSTTVAPAGTATAPIAPHAPAVTLPAPKAAAPADAIKTALENIYFNFDSANLTDSARTVLNRNAEYLKQHPAAALRIEGHCDERGSAEYNLALGERRATAAQRYLSALGLPTERLAIISFGKEKPLDSGHDESAWRINRRDEFVVTK